MSGGHPVVLLPPAQPAQPAHPGQSAHPAQSAQAADRDWSGLAAALGRDRRVLTPDIRPNPDRPVVLEEPALAVLAAVSAAGLDAAALCGIGYGAMVAMMVAAGFGERVTALVLSTARTPESTALLSIHHGVRALLPAAMLQRLGGRTDQVVQALDQVRAVDYRNWAGRIEVPTLVLVGQRDVANLAPIQALARGIANAKLQIVAGAGAGWQHEEPERFATLAAEFVDAATPPK